MNDQLPSLAKTSLSLEASPFVIEQTSKRLAELGVAIHEQVAFAIEEAVFEVRQVAGYLLHPRFIGMDRATCEVNAARFQFHHKQVVRDETALGPDLDRREVERKQYRTTKPQTQAVDHRKSDG